MLFSFFSVFLFLVVGFVLLGVKGETKHHVLHNLERFLLGVKRWIPRSWSGGRVGVPASFAALKGKQLGQKDVGEHHRVVHRVRCLGGHV